MAFSNTTPAADAGTAHRAQPMPRGSARRATAHGVPGATTNPGVHTGPVGAAAPAVQPGDCPGGVPSGPGDGE